ncbi:hypothetical protein LXN10_03185 [Arcobacter sp. KX21116]|jgi:hypothetical protein|uniref:hypothetical protein n=1 Tax=Arcobacter iocasae TaxID=2906515 RepID=UPI0035D43F3E
MSMSQEEIEALMNGLDISENENSTSDDASSDENDSDNMSEDDIANLIAETNLSNKKVEDEDSSDTTSKSSEEPETDSTEKMSDNDIDALLNSLEDEPEEETSVSSDEIDSIINGIVSDDEKSTETVNKSESNETVDTSEIDDLIAGLENDKDSESESSDDDYLKDLDLNLDAESIDELDKVEVKEEPQEEPQEEPEVTSTPPNKKRGNNVVNVEQINIPNQLGEVANDSEEKATKIFDALSYILEDNEELRKTTKSLDGFIQSQHKMLEMLNQKFPNVKEFSENLESVKELLDKPKEIQSRLHNRDKELFETMELMQFHDINRQKIERVMGLVINLSRQLNSIFDDETNSVNIPGATHLPGDTSNDLVNSDDLESLIAEFGKSKD